MTPGGIVLDLDGPILEGIDRHYTVYREILTQNGFPALPRDLYWATKRNLVNRRELLGMSGAAGMYDLFLQTWLERIELREYLRLDRLQPGVLEVLNDWCSRGIPIFLATLRNNKPNLEWQLQELGLLRYFRGVVVVVHGDPHASQEPWKSKAAAIHSLLPARSTDSIYWVGDTEVDVKAARALGAKSCAVLCGLRTEEHLRSLSPDYVLEDVATFAAMLQAQIDGGAGGN